MNNPNLNEVINWNNIIINSLETGKFYIFHIFFIGVLQDISNNLQRMERLLLYIYANLVNNNVIPEAPDFPLQQVLNPHPNPPGGDNQ